METEQAKNSLNLSENEITALLEIMFELGFMSKNLSYYDLELYTEKFYNKFTYKKWLQLYFLLVETIFFLNPDKHYRPKELNNIISNKIKNLLSNSRILGTITDEQLLSLKEGNLMSPTEMSELLEIMVKDLKILENIKGAKNIKKVNYIRPGRKDNDVTKYEGFHSEYRLSNDFITKKKIFTGLNGIRLLKNFITKNQLVKHHFLFTLSTINYNSSKIINKKITLSHKERLKNEIINKNINLQEDNFYQIFNLLLLFCSTKDEIESLSNNFIDAILKSEDYTFLLFLINVSVLINKL
ncbi:MAG TPA: hypothetical protein VJ697_11890 [Nitrososphaeraceae archaeon]|nr:hypothetical protein [Nitrososphaeraceae archaeon]